VQGKGHQKALDPQRALDHQRELDHQQMALLLALQPVLMKKSLLEMLPKRPQLKRPQPILLLTTSRPMMKTLQRNPAAEILETCQTLPIHLLLMMRVQRLLRQLSRKALVLRPNATTSSQLKLTLPTRSKMEMKRWVCCWPSSRY